MRKLTASQLAALKWLPERGGRHWGGTKFGAPNRCSLGTLIREGLAARVGVPSMDLYAITDAGRAALAEQEKGDA